jgi:hypothetical protein
MVMLAMVEWGLHLDETVLTERTVQRGRVRSKHVDVSEPSAVRRVERRDLRSLEEHHRSVADLANAPENGVGDHCREGRDSFLCGEHLRDRLPGCAAPGGSKWPKLVCEDAVDGGAVDQRSDGRPEGDRINHFLSNTSEKRECVPLRSDRDRCPRASYELWLNANS